MTDEMRALDERIARALGWDVVDPGDIMGSDGPWRKGFETNFGGCPGYSTDAALLPEMWAECERRRWEWWFKGAGGEVDTEAVEYEAWVNDSASYFKPIPAVTAFARAFDAAIAESGRE
jgi:hypothetical protein